MNTAKSEIPHNNALLLHTTGAVVIGRNEGERLQICLRSLTIQLDKIVYVDSGSTDTSVSFAKELGLHVVELDLSIPFTAARARNAGFDFLTTHYPNLLFVQFIDGDCELVSTWLEEATHFLQEHPTYAVVCGRRRERYPDKSIYNLLCDIEWDTPIGNAKACGGDALIRIIALKEAQGYRPDCIAGEEPELCVRLRANGWFIYRLNAEMTLHDAAMMKASQWWQRSVRSGYAYALGFTIHGNTPEQHKKVELMRTIVWGGIIPAAGILLVLTFSVWGWLLFIIYPIQVIRLALRGNKSTALNWLYASHLMLSKIPECIGVLQFIKKRLLKQQAKLIEYK